MSRQATVMKQHGLKSALVAKAAMAQGVHMLPGHRVARTMKIRLVASPFGSVIALLVLGASLRMMRVASRNGSGRHANPPLRRLKPARHAMRAPGRWLLILCQEVAFLIHTHHCCWSAVNTMLKARFRAKYSNGGPSRSRACFKPAWSAPIVTTRIAVRYARKAMPSARNATYRHVLTRPNTIATQLERRARNVFPAICLR